MKGFDIIPKKSKPKRKNRFRKKGSSHKRSPYSSSGSIFSWIILIGTIIAISSFMTSNQTINDTNKPPESSIKNQVLADKLDDSENKKKSAIKQSEKEESPENSNKNLDNAIPEPNSKTQDSDTIHSQSKQSISTTLNKLELKIKILNGSGKSKQAANAKERLEQAGYMIASIDTANNIYNTSIIYHNKDKSENLDDIFNILEVTAKSEIDPNITKEYDYVIVIGKDYIQ